MENKTNKFIEFFKNKLVIHTIVASLCLIVGILFCVIPTQTLDAIRTISLIAFLLVGFVSTIIYCLAPSGYHNMKWLGVGGFCIVIGILLVYVVPAFVIGLAILMIIGGGQNVWTGIKEFKNTNDKKLFFEIIFGGIVVALGIVSLVLSSTKLAENIVMIVVGSMLILKGIFDFVLLFSLKKQTTSATDLTKNQPASTDEEQFENKELEENNNSDTTENS